MGQRHIFWDYLHKVFCRLYLRPLPEKRKIGIDKVSSFFGIEKRKEAKREKIWKPFPLVCSWQVVPGQVDRG